MELRITVESGLCGDGFNVHVTDGEKPVFQEKYRYGYIERLYASAIEAACEAIQVATMAQKFIDSQKEREKCRSGLLRSLRGFWKKV